MTLLSVLAPNIIIVMNPISSYWQKKQINNITKRLEGCWCPPMTIIAADTTQPSYPDVIAFWGNFDFGKGRLVEIPKTGVKYLPNLGYKQEPKNINWEDYHKESLNSSNFMIKIIKIYIKIEFCIDTLICVECGAFDTAVVPNNQELKQRLNDARRLIRYESGVLDTFVKKIKYLRSKRFINKSESELYHKINNIRNVFAHQFNFPSSHKSNSKNITAILKIFESCWSNTTRLIENKATTEILEWLFSLSAEISEDQQLKSVK